MTTNTSDGFASDRFYSYTLPGVLLVWLAVVLMIGSWLAE
jgi:hypothetical protein